MKKILIVLGLSSVLVFSLIGCSNSSNNESTETTTETVSESTEATETTAETTVGESTSQQSNAQRISNNETIQVTPAGCDSRGYYAVVCDYTGTYSFNKTNSEKYPDMTWTVYVMDKQYDDATRYISESESPALEGNGQLNLKKGQYIYVRCSLNTFNSDSEELPTDTSLEISHK